MFKRGDVVKLKTDLLGLVGVVDWYQPESEPGAVVQWFVGGTHRNLCNPAHLIRVEGYEFEAALALGDTSTVLELYRHATLPRTVYNRETEAYRRAIDSAISGVNDLSPIEALTRLLQLRRAVEGLKSE